MKDIFGKALMDYQSGNYSEDIITFSSLGEEDVIPLPYLFRSYEEMPQLEKEALRLCKGEVLDIGCGAGIHSAHLAKKEVQVTALDVSAGAIEVCRQRGLQNVVHADIMDYSDKKFDTLLLLMNGIGIVGNLDGLKAFLDHARSLLNQHGNILCDSSDIIYMFETSEGDYDLSKGKGYYGEVKFIMQYKGEKSNTFNWLYLDFDTLQHTAFECGYLCELLLKGDHFDYLVKLSLNS